ncbi:MAG: SRPBCC family protein [Capsulimonadales bacterium]|nr:SRPBCC family protein [Capsulimonadales bacterium]
MPRIESGIVIRAPRERVIAVARDNESFPEFMEDVHSVVVRERSDDGRRVVSDWVGIVPRFGNKIRWTEEDIWDTEAGTCTFRQVSGDYDRFEGIWTFTADGDETTRFDSVLEYQLEIPLVGSIIKAIVDKTMRNNLEATLIAIKKRCEAS